MPPAPPAGGFGAGVGSVPWRLPGSSESSGSPCGWVGSAEGEAPVSDGSAVGELSAAGGAGSASGSPGGGALGCAAGAASAGEFTGRPWASYSTAEPPLC